MFWTSVVGQRLDAYINFGATTQMSYNLDQGGSYYKRGKKPNIKAFIGVVLKSDINYFSTDYGLSVWIYSKGLGNSQNPLYSDIQIDFVNSLSIGFKLPENWSEDFPYVELDYPKSFRHERVKPIRTLSYGGFYGIMNRYKNSIYFSTNYIINNHKRNQNVGSFALTFGDFTFHYYNDGTLPLFDIFGLNDRFDRWWTGGGGIFIHNNEGNYNTVEFTFDQFTGYQPFLFELSGILGVDIPQYSSRRRNYPTKIYNFEDSNSSFNSSAYNLRIGLSENYAFDMGFAGKLRSKGGRYFGIQDIIHIVRNFPLHPNDTNNTFHIGVSYNNIRKYEDVF